MEKRSGMNTELKIGDRVAIGHDRIIQTGTLIKFNGKFSGTVEFDITGEQKRKSLENMFPIHEYKGKIAVYCPKIIDNEKQSFWKQAHEPKSLNKEKVVTDQSEVTDVFGNPIVFGDTYYMVYRSHATITFQTNQQFVPVKCKNPNSKMLTCYATQRDYTLTANNLHEWVYSFDMDKTCLKKSTLLAPVSTDDKRLKEKFEQLLED